MTRIEKWGGFRVGGSVLLALGLALACSSSVSVEEDDTPFTNNPQSNGGVGGGGGSGGSAGLNLPVGIAGEGGSVSMAGEGGVANESIRCDSPTLDRNTQLMVCASGIAHRDAARACSPLPSDGSSGAAGAGENTGGAGGETLGSLGALGGLYSSCREDRECEPSLACFCLGEAGKGGICAPATCKSDADCGASSWCAADNSTNHGDPGFSCLGPRDECSTDADCHDPQLTCVFVAPARKCVAAGE